MKKYYCIYKYTKEPQSTETDETDSDSDTKRQDGDNNTYFLTGVYVWASNHKDMTS